MVRLCTSLFKQFYLVQIKQGEILSFGGALHLSQAVWRLRPEGSADSEAIMLWFVTCGAMELVGHSSIHPLQAPLWGSARCLMLESEGLFECFSCDLDSRLTSSPLVIRYISEDIFSNENQHDLLWNELCYVSAALGDVANDFEIAYLVLYNNIFVALTQISYRDGMRFTNRLQRKQVALPPDVRSDTMYLKDGNFPSTEFGPWFVPSSLVLSASILSCPDLTL